MVGFQSSRSYQDKFKFGNCVGLVSFHKNILPLRTNEYPLENQWLEDAFPTEIVPFGDMLRNRITFGSSRSGYSC